MTPLLLFSILVMSGSSGDEPTSRSVANLIGTKALEWNVADWINSKPLTLKDLKGKVVLVRWWTGGGCPYCAATPPSLNEFHAKYGNKGLVVIGFYHHKEEGPLTLAMVRDYTESFGFQFPVAVDPGWRTLKKWWLNGKKRQWTSVTFLIDRQGVIRHIHPGGQYAPGSTDYKELKAKIEELLQER